MSRCPTCNSPSPSLHPAMQWEGEVEICIDPFHGPSPQANFKGADVLRDATRHLAKAFRMNFTRDEAKDNLEARALLLRVENAVLDDAEVMIEKLPRSAA